jgi:hypothetical protein
VDDIRFLIGGRIAGIRSDLHNPGNSYNFSISYTGLFKNGSGRPDFIVRRHIFIVQIQKNLILNI